CFTQNHGVMRGLYKPSKKDNKACLGCAAQVKWSARLEEHLGTWQFETTTNPFIHTMNDATKHKVLLSVLELLNAALKEREVNWEIYNATTKVIQALETSANILKDYVFFELTLLQHIGYGLDLSKCAATNSRENLKYISPKSGKAVSAAAGQPYDSKLFKLPAFLNDNTLEPTSDDIRNALKVSRYFLEKVLPLGRLSLVGG
ncbi:MAG: DNA repair protein RecO, partial [Rickettsiales bacterium]